MQATPATWQMLLEVGWKAAPGFKILCGGEALPPELANALRNTNAAVWNLYGPTETTIWSTAQQFHGSSGGISIGRPIANTEIYLLDNYLQLVPIGVAGELPLAAPVWPAATLIGLISPLKISLPHPFSAEPGTYLYKTGDLARYLPDGNIEFLGRTDDQVKIRGFRIEPGEIEAALADHPDVRQSVVLVREDEAGEKRLVAYVVPKLQRVPTTSAFRDFLQQKLPHYMMPSAFVSVNSLPRTPHGKVDRGALPAPDQRTPDLKDAFVAPRTELEKLIAGIWAEVLKLESVGIEDNFFDLGGHSLKATQIVSRLRNALRMELPLRTLFEYPTVTNLAVQIAHAQACKIRPKEAADVLADLESLSDEEVERLLAQ